jgi:hypothetical protein
MYALGRLLQLLGLTILPVAVLMEFQQTIDLRQYLTITAFGATIFAMGYVLQFLGNKGKSE